MSEQTKHKKSAIRVFVCSSCGHHLRLGRAYCGDCYQPTPVYNRLWAICSVAAAVTIAVVAGLLRSLL